MARVRKKRRKKKIAGRNNGPARQRYWANKTLEKNKIKHLMKYNGMTRDQAYVHWHNVRVGRKK